MFANLDRSKRRLMGFRFLVRLATAITLLCTSLSGAHAQDANGKEEITTQSAPSVPIQSPKSTQLLTFGLDYSWLSRTGFSDRNFSTGHLGEETISGSLKFRIPISETLSLSIGGSYEGLFFNVPKSITSTALPLRSQLETISLNVGANYRFSEKLEIFADVSPFIASDFVDISSDDLGIGGRLGFRYAPCGDSHLFFVLGISARSNSRLPVLPVGGVHWEPNALFDVNLLFPRPELDFHLTSRVTLFAGGEFYGGTFRVGKNVGTNIDQPRYNNALLDYQEVRVGGGIKLKLLDNLSVETAAGSTVYRKFDYFRFGQQTSPQNAPYIQTSVKFSF